MDVYLSLTAYKRKPFSFDCWSLLISELILRRKLRVVAKQDIASAATILYIYAAIMPLSHINYIATISSQFRCKMTTYHRVTRGCKAPYWKLIINN